jgi:hypothetical protein
MPLLRDRSGERKWDENDARRRQAIQASEEKNTVLVRRHRVHRQTIAQWKARDTPFDARVGPKNPRLSVLALEDEAIILAHRWRTRLSLDDSLVRLRRLMPKLSRSLRSIVMRRSPRRPLRPRGCFLAVWSANSNKRSTGLIRITKGHYSPTGDQWQWKLGGGRSPPLCGRLPRHRDRPHCDDSSLLKAGRTEGALARRRNSTRLRTQTVY